MIRIDPDTDELRTFLPPGSLPDPNGITVAGDGNTLYVAGWYSVSRVDRSTKQISRLAKPPGVADGCFDGLNAYRGDLIGGVTTGAIAGDRFYFPANVQFRKMGTADAFDPVKILELRLG